MTSKLTAAARLTPSQVDDAARDYLSGWDSPDPVEATAERGLSPVDAERLAETYGPRDGRRIGRALVALCRQRSASSAAARALRAIPSERRSDQSRANGRRGGRPVLMILVDDLGRSVGYCEAAGSRAGEIVEYGSRILARTRPDGYIEPQTFRVEGRATLRRTRPADREDIRYNSREWDVQ